LRTAAELGINRWNAKLMCGKSVSRDIETYINGVQLRQDFIKVSNVLRISEPQLNLKIPSLEETVELVMQVQKQELLEKVKKLWHERYGEVTPTSGTLSFLMTEPDFDSMAPKKLLQEYLRLKRKRTL